MPAGPTGRLRADAHRSRIYMALVPFQLIRASLQPNSSELRSANLAQLQHKLSGTWRATLSIAPVRARLAAASRFSLDQAGAGLRYFRIALRFDHYLLGQGWIRHGLRPGPLVVPPTQHNCRTSKRKGTGKKACDHNCGDRQHWVPRTDRVVVRTSGYASRIPSKSAGVRTGVIGEQAVSGRPGQGCPIPATRYHSMTEIPSGVEKAFRLYAWRSEPADTVSVFLHTV